MVAFYNCIGLESVTFSENSQLTSIGAAAFQNCSSLTEIAIPDSVVSIGHNAFEYCDSLTEVVIPDSVQILGRYVFWRSSTLTIYCEANEQPVDWNVEWNNFVYSKLPVYWYSETEPALNSEGTAYDGNYWRYVDGVPTKW